MAVDQATMLREMIEHAQAAEQKVSVPVDMSEMRMSRETPALRAVAITSGKGGVGKTNIACNLAVRLAAMGRRVLLMDADLGTANADVICGVQPVCNLAHVVAGRRALEDAIVTGPGGVRLIPGASGLAQMAALNTTERQNLLHSFQQLEQDSDLMLIDTGAGIGPNVLGFLESCDEQLVVTTPEPTAITDAYAVIKTLVHRVGPERVNARLLVNMVRDERDARQVFARVDGVCRKFLGLPLRFAGYVERDPKVLLSVLGRSPFVVAHPTCPAAKCITQLAHRFDRHAAEPVQSSWVSRFASLWKTG